MQKNESQTSASIPAGEISGERLEAIRYDQKRNFAGWASPALVEKTMADLLQHIAALESKLSFLQEPVEGGIATDELREKCAWTEAPFGFVDEPGEHDPCYLIMPGGAMLSFCHHATNGVDQARAQWIQRACNAYPRYASAISMLAACRQDIDVHESEMAELAADCQRMRQERDSLLNSSTVEQRLCIPLDDGSTPS